jgi:hypothetical protein
MMTACAGTLSGGVGYLAPMDESAFRRLGMLQSALLSAIPHTAGLHPQAYRALRRERLLRNRKVHTHPHLHVVITLSSNVWTTH